MDNNIEKLGSVIDVFTAPMGISSGVRKKMKSIELKKDYGIVGDKFAQKNLDRTVLIIGSIAYDIAKENNIDLELGFLGENILLDFDANILEIGDIINIDELKLEVTEVCTICNHLSVYDKKLPILIKDNRGVYCKINQSAIISKNMKVYKL